MSRDDNAGNLTDVTEQQTYLSSERGLFTPTCPRCQGTNMQVDWTAADIHGERWLPGVRTCLNEDCPGRAHLRNPFAVA